MYVLQIIISTIETKLKQKQKLKKYDVFKNLTWFDFKHCKTLSIYSLVSKGKGMGIAKR